MSKLLGDDLRTTLNKWVIESYNRGNSTFQRYVPYILVHVQTYSDMLNKLEMRKESISCMQLC